MSLYYEKIHPKKDKIKRRKLKNLNEKVEISEPNKVIKRRIRQDLLEFENR